MDKKRNGEEKERVEDHGVQISIEKRRLIRETNVVSQVQEGRT